MALHIPRRRVLTRSREWSTRFRVILGTAVIAVLFLLFRPHKPFRPFFGPHPPFERFELWSAQSWKLSLPELQDLVAGTKGYYVRDWSVGLGWNNLRYIIEASLLHAQLLNRVLVLPSYVYARSCEFDIDVCSHYGLFVDRAEVVGWDGWNGAPLSTLAWQLPIQIMLDIPHLRSHYPVILASEFYELHGLDPDYESLAGDWNRGDYEVNVTFPPIHVITNSAYDNDIIRVDKLDGFPKIHTIDPEIDQALMNALGDGKTLTWDDAVGALKNSGLSVKNDAYTERLLNSGGWVVTYSFTGAAGMDYTKTVVNPLREVVPRSRVRGFVENFRFNTEVLLLEGETHLGRKPGGLRFSTPGARDAFSRMVLDTLRPISPVRELARTMALRIQKMCHGRMWMAAHMRRGDFTLVGWAMEKGIEQHLDRVKNRFATGRERLRDVLYKSSRRGSGDLAKAEKLLPREGDPFFIATDERTPEGLDYLRNNSAILFNDLLTIEDRRNFGWPLIFTDVLGLVEQTLAAEAGFFYGHALSSFAGGVLNIRTANGFDPDTILID